MVRNNPRKNHAALVIGVVVTLGFALMAWLAVGFFQALGTNTAVPNISAATLPPGLTVTDGHRVCDSSDCWLELQVVNESGIPDRQIVENLPGVRNSGLGDTAASLCGSPNWFRFRQPCTYFYYNDAGLSIQLRFISLPPFAH